MNKDAALTMLTDLIAIDSINPMDKPHKGAQPVEHRVCAYLEDVFAQYDVKVERDLYSERHENLMVTIPGARTDAPTFFEAHADTVPADDWGPESLVPRVEGDMVYGRGACDDKGSLVSMVLALVDVVESGDTPADTVLFMAAGDEEYAQTGIKRFRTENRLIGRAIFGEPTSLAPIVQHKGTIRWDMKVVGRSAHTSRPELGVNAIHGAMQVIDAIALHETSVQQRFTNELMTPPTLTVTMIDGGRTRNAVPDLCTISVDYRIVPGMVPQEARDAVIEALASLSLGIEHSDVQLITPPLATDPADPFSQSVLATCQANGDTGVELEGRPYGTDASWVSDIAPAIVLGPGSIDHAHAIGECVDINEVLACARIYRDIMMRGGDV